VSLTGSESAAPRACRLFPSAEGLKVGTFPEGGRRLPEPIVLFSVTALSRPLAPPRWLLAVVDPNPLLDVKSEIRDGWMSPLLGPPSGGYSSLGFA